MESEEVAIAGLLGRCPAMERLKRRSRMFGPSDVRVHVFGETGTGKEMVAKALHAASPGPAGASCRSTSAGLQRRPPGGGALRPLAGGVHGGGGRS